MALHSPRATIRMKHALTKTNHSGNLSSEQGNLGKFFITNIRIVWYANLAQNFNVSVPYMQMKKVRVKESKFGKALVVETQPRCGGYILGFKIHPPEKLDGVLDEILSLFNLFSKAPIFGVDFHKEEAAPSLEQLTVARVDDDVEIIDEDSSDAFAAYFADGGGAAGFKEIVFDESIGLACESLPEGWNMNSLWNITSDEK